LITAPITSQAIINLVNNTIEDSRAATSSLALVDRASTSPREKTGNPENRETEGSTRVRSQISISSSSKQQPSQREVVITLTLPQVEVDTTEIPSSSKITEVDSSNIRKRIISSTIQRKQVTNSITVRNLNTKRNLMLRNSPRDRTIKREINNIMTTLRKADSITRKVESTESSAVVEAAEEVVAVREAAITIITPRQVTIRKEKMINITIREDLREAMPTVKREAQTRSPLDLLKLEQPCLCLLEEPSRVLSHPRKGRDRRLQK